MKATRRQYLRTRQSAARPALVWVIAALALLAGCKGRSSETQPPQKAGGGVPQTAEMKELRAVVPDVLVERVTATARSAFRESKEAQAKWRTPEELGLAFYRSTELLTAVARADNLTSDPSVVVSVQSGLIDEYARQLFKNIIGEIPVSDDEIKAIYEERLPTYRVKGKFSIRQIFLNTVDNPGTEKAKEALAEKALAEINSGTSFVTVAKKYSDNKVKDERIGPVDYGEINPDLEAAILALEPGQHSNVLRTKYGYYIFRLEEIVRATTKTLESVRDEIVAAVREEKFPQYYGMFGVEMEKRYPATKHYDLLGNPNTPEDALVVDSKFFKLTAGDYLKRINEDLTTGPRERLSIAENRAEYLDSQLQTQRILTAAKEMGLTDSPDLQVVKAYLRDMALTRLVLERAAAKLTYVSEDEVRKHYEEYRDSYSTKPEMFRLRDIMLPYRQPEGTSARQIHLIRQRILETAQQLTAQLKAGAKFEDLARQYSASASRKDGGELGFIDPDRRFNKLRGILEKMKDGEWTEPIDEGEQVGISIYLLEERKPAVTVPLDDRLMKGLAEVLRSEKRRRLGMDIRVNLAAAYHPGLSAAETRKIIDETVAKAMGVTK